MPFDEIDTLAINTIRTLAMDAIEKANSGHPGAAMGLAPVGWTLFSRYLRHDPAAPKWVDRDRFVLSGGHASMLLYALLHLTGYDLSLDEIKRFRQWGSLTPGHPEYRHTAGVEVTTGPLGQGCAHSVGLALAEAHLAAEFPSAPIDHRTWVFCGDGDLMEGLSSEAASLAGHLRLGKLCWIWDNNNITIEGSTGLAFTENVPARFHSYGWQVLEVEDANDLEALSAAFEASISESGRPTFIAVRSHIAFGAPKKQDTAGAHGSPLGEEEIRSAKANYGWPEDASFLVPEEVRERGREIALAGAEKRAEWERVFARFSGEEPEAAGELRRRWKGQLPEGLVEGLPEGADMASRAASGKVLNSLAGLMPELLGGSADLAPSCKTWIEGSPAMAPGSYAGRNLHFGIREHAMGAALNGMNIHGGLRAFGSTFLVFADYVRPSIRLAALMGVPSIFVFTHDSIWVGEDGPTHQPVEQIAGLRAIPGLVVLRPADAKETSAAWLEALKRRDGPTALILSRQTLPLLELETGDVMEGLSHGAYIVREASDLRLILMATGSEVSLALEAAGLLEERGFGVRVLSMPSWELFAAEDAGYRQRLLPKGVPRIAIETGVSMGWREWVGEHGRIIALDRFGASAPGEIVAEKLGFTAQRILNEALELLIETMEEDDEFTQDSVD